MDKAHQPGTTGQSADIEVLAGSLDCLTEHQLCRLGGITENTAEAWRKRGTGPAYVRFGNTVLYPRRVVADFLAANVRERRPLGAKGLL